ncbi:hypothetical protein [Sediminitomix flava]|uniref:Uncharacterized protein n=1 Tax=Sediminitomix flava TaxID=379075 RepID=A0A315Z967_SEDFL|nr:hypothetical protein [Sediminitomix flava]PWJ40076.1 hypothetical protein BC781_105139 [Sediminitomix flava]
MSVIRDFIVEHNPNIQKIDWENSDEILISGEIWQVKNAFEVHEISQLKPIGFIDGIIVKTRRLFVCIHADYIRDISHIEEGYFQFDFSSNRTVILNKENKLEADISDYLGTVEDIEYLCIQDKIY